MTSESPHTDPMFGLDDKGSTMPGVYLSPRRLPQPTKPVVPDTPYKHAGQCPEEFLAGPPDPCDLLAFTTGGHFVPPSSSAAVLERNERERSKAPLKFSPSQPGSASSTTAGCVQRARRWACWLPAIRNACDHNFPRLHLLGLNANHSGHPMLPLTPPLPTPNVSPRSSTFHARFLPPSLSRHLVPAHRRRASTGCVLECTAVWRVYGIV